MNENVVNAMKQGGFNHDKVCAVLSNEYGEPVELVGYEGKGWTHFKVPSEASPSLINLNQVQMYAREIREPVAQVGVTQQKGNTSFGMFIGL